MVLVAVNTREAKSVSQYAIYTTTVLLILIEIIKKLCSINTPG